MSKKNCPICLSERWNELYSSHIRNGKFLKQVRGSILEYEKCKAQKLSSDVSLSISDYQLGNIQDALGQSDTVLLTTQFANGQEET